MNIPSEEPSTQPAISEVRLRANRQNAQKSSGPRSPVGKARAARNSTKHGILVSAARIRGDDRSSDGVQFGTFVEGLRDDLRPVGVMEDLQVQTIAVNYWRLRRVYAAEVNLLRPVRMPAPEFATAIDTFEMAARHEPDPEARAICAEMVRNLRTIATIDDFRRLLNSLPAQRVCADDRGLLERTLATVASNAADEVERIFSDMEFTERPRAEQAQAELPRVDDSERLWRYETRIMKAITTAYSMLLRLQAERLNHYDNA